MIPLLYIGLAQSIFASFLIATKKPRLLPDVILAFWLFLIALEMGISINMEKVRLSGTMLNFSLLILLTFMPLMYFYVKTLLAEIPKFSFKELVHFIPHIFFFLWLVLFLKDEPIFYGSSERYQTMIRVFRSIFALYFFVSVIFYTQIIFRSIGDHQNKIKDRFSFTSESITLNWLKFILFLFVLAFSAMILMGFLGDKTNFPFDPRFFIRVPFTLFAFGVSYFGVRQPVLFKQSMENAPNANEQEIPKARYEKSGLSDDNAHEYENRLKEYMKTEKPYLNPELTIKDISDHLNISRHHITQVLNEKIQKNFYNYINEFRLIEVKKRIVAPQYSHLTLIGIAFDCGFNSKSAFNSIFKKNTGKTPSEFKQVQS
jgi:AraC-like DNA-binding protein